MQNNDPQCGGLGVLLATSLSAQAGIAYTFTEIEVPGSIITSPSAMNNIGQIVGTYIDDAGTGMAFERRAASTSMST